MRRMLVALAVAALAAPGGSQAGGPSGSTEGRKTSSNTLRCAGGQNVQGMRLYASQSKGAEVCNAGPTVPIHGRVIVDARKRYVAVDGDRHNAGPATGYARIDQTGLHCSSGRDQDSTRSGTGGDPSTCDGG